MPSASTTAPATTAGIDTGTTAAPDPSELDWFSNGAEPAGTYGSEQPTSPSTAPDGSDLTAEEQELDRCYRDAYLERWGTDVVPYDTVLAGEGDPQERGKAELWLLHVCGWSSGVVDDTGVACFVSDMIDHVGLDESWRLLYALEYNVNSPSGWALLVQTAQQCGLPVSDWAANREKCAPTAYRERFGNDPALWAQWRTDIVSLGLSSVGTTKVDLWFKYRCGHTEESWECFAQELVDRYGLDDAAQLQFEAALDGGPVYIDDTWQELREPATECEVNLYVYLPLKFDTLTPAGYTLDDVVVQ